MARPQVQLEMQSAQTELIHRESEARSLRQRLAEAEERLAVHSGALEVRAGEGGTVAELCCACGLKQFA